MRGGRGEEEGVPFWLTMSPIPMRVAEVAPLVRRGLVSSRVVYFVNKDRPKRSMVSHNDASNRHNSQQSAIVGGQLSATVSNCQQLSTSDKATRNARQ